MRLPSVSLETAIGLFVGLFVGLVEMNWELRGLGVLVTAGLAIHIARRLDASIIIKVAVATIAIGLLIVGTYHQIWASFTEDFPTVTGEAALTRLIEFFSLAACVIAGYAFLIRPRAKEGYRVLPAQLIAFGAVVMIAGLFPIVIGLGWQFKQNWDSGVSPTGAPVSLPSPPAPQRPQIALPAVQPALPAPNNVNTPLISGYGLTAEGIHQLANGLYKAKDHLPKVVIVQRTGSEPSSRQLTSDILVACDRSGVSCQGGGGLPNSPDETGVMIYVADPRNPPDTAKTLQSVLPDIGLHAPFVARQGPGPNDFMLFIGPSQ
jgi:hypothetical protein